MDTSIRRPGRRQVSAAALVAVGIALAASCSGNNSAGNVAPTTPSQPGPDLSTWLSYSNQQYGVALRYPPNYSVGQPTNQLQPAPIFRVGFQLGPFTPASPLPPLFAIDVYNNTSQQSLDAWLASNVVSLGTATRTMVQIGGQSGIEIAYQALLAPNTFYYVARGSFVYRFISVGTYSDTMLGTVQFT
jgi:hypothetical protein